MSDKVKNEEDSKEFVKDAHNVVGGFIPYYQSFVNLGRFIHKWLWQDNDKGISIKKKLVKP
jgi:hypothetical protein